MIQDINSSLNNTVDLSDSLNAGLVLNSFYSALLLHRFDGYRITPELEENVLKLVLQQWSEIKKTLKQEIK
jgi:hypothetical protein